MNKSAGMVITALLVVAAFLAGNALAKSRAGGEKLAQPATTPSVAPQAETPVFVPQERSDRPEVKFFVMSFCPYGNQAEAGLAPVYQLLPDEVVWSPRYIVSDKKASCEQACSRRIFNDWAKDQCTQAISQGKIKDMDECRQYFPYQTEAECRRQDCADIKSGEWESLHGDQELRQNVREICAFNQGNPGRWWRFVTTINQRCTVADVADCWAQVAEEVGYDPAKLTACEKSQATALLKKELAESNKYQAYSSPTVLINDTVYSGGRSPENYKKAICSAFTTPPASCQTILGQETQAPAGACN